MDTKNMQEQPGGEAEPAEPPQLPQELPEETGATGVPSALDVLQSGIDATIEASLRFPAEEEQHHLSEAQGTSATATAAEPAEPAQLVDAQAGPLEDIEFPSAHNSPDMHGATSTYLSSRWEAIAAAGAVAGSDCPQSPRSEHSFHSSMYHGSARTSMAGGFEPRQLIRSTEQRSGLETGDVIMLMHKGRPYIAVQARLPYKDDAIHTVLELAPEDAELPSEGLAYLEVIRQGPFIGLRSSASGNRFLQPRRKAPHRLVFFNPNCGAWEQWDVLPPNAAAAQPDTGAAAAASTAAGDRPGGALSMEPVAAELLRQPWSVLPLVLRSRRLMQVQLSVDVVRVGFYSTSGAATVGPAGGLAAPTPRTLLPAIPEDCQLEDNNLRRISNVLVREWFKFVDHEKVLREGLERDLAGMMGELAELKLNTIAQVEFLRVHMNEELGSLAEHVAMRDGAIATLKDWLKRTQQVAAGQLARLRYKRVLAAWRQVTTHSVYCQTAVLRMRARRSAALVARAFEAWSGHSRGVAGTAAKLTYAVQRRSRTLMSRVLAGWQAVLAHRAQLRARLTTAVARRSTLLLSHAFAGWNRVSQHHRAGRAALDKALYGVRQTWVSTAFSAWRAGVELSRRAAVQAEHLSARRSGRQLAYAFSAWRGRVALQQAAVGHYNEQLTMRAFAGWRWHVEASQQLQELLLKAVTTLSSVRTRCVLRTWHETAVVRGALRRRLTAFVVRRSGALLGAAFGAWSGAVVQRRRWRAALERHLRGARRQTAGAVLAAWRARAALTAWRKARLVTAVARASGRRLSAAWYSWRHLASSNAATRGRLALAQGRLQRVRLAAVWSAWSHHTAHLKSARAAGVLMARRSSTTLLSAFFREWRLLTTKHHARRAATVRAMHPSTRALMTRVLATWWARHAGDASSLHAPAQGRPQSLLPSRPSSQLPSGTSLSPVTSAEQQQYAYAQQLLLLGTDGQQDGQQELSVEAAAAAAAARSQPGMQRQTTASCQPMRRPAPAPGPMPPSAAHEPPTAASASTVAASAPVSHGGAAPVPETHVSAISSPTSPLVNPDQRPVPASHLSTTSRSEGGGAPPASSTAPIPMPPSPTTPQAPANTPSRGSAGGNAAGRSYRDALAAGIANIAALATRSRSPSPQPLSPALSPRASSTGRARTSDPVTTTTTAHGSSRGSTPSRRAAASSSGISAPFIPANTAVIGACGSPMLLEMAPGRSGEGMPITPVGLPELLDGSEIEQEEPASESQPQAPVQVVEEEQQAVPERAARSGESGLLQVSSFAFDVPRAAAALAEVAIAPRLSGSMSSVVTDAGVAAGNGLGRWLAGEVLRQWRQLAAGGRALQKALQEVEVEVVAERRQRVARAVMRGWRAQVEAAQQLAAVAAAVGDRAVARAHGRLQLEVLAAWHFTAARRVQTRALLSRHAARQGSLLARCALQGWHDAAAHSRAVDRLVGRLLKRHEAGLCARVLSAWRDEAAEGAARRSAAASLALGRDRELLACAMHGWCGAAAVRRERVARGCRAQRQVARRRLQGAFSRWRYATAAAAERAALAERARRAAALRAAFGGWLKAAAGPYVRGGGAVDPEAALARAAAWHSRRLARSCLAALAQHCSDMRLLREHAAALGHGCDLRLAAEALAGWRAAAVVARQAKVAVAKLLARSSRRQLHASFSAWLRETQAARGARAAAEALGGLRDGALLAEALAGWQEAVVARKAARGALDAKRRKLDRGRLARAFAAWQEGVARLRGAKRFQQHAARRVQAVLLRYAFASWAAHAADLRTARAAAEAMHTSSSRALLHDAFHSWRALRQTLASARSKAASWAAIQDVKQLRGAWEGWLARVDRARELARAAQAMCDRRERGVLPAVLRAWAAAAGGGMARTRRLQRSALAHLVLRRCLATQRRFFKAWRDVAVEARVRKDELRRCIKRKKLAFTLFKQWYWEAFDSDVQATIRRMFHTTDPAAHSPQPSHRYPHVSTAADGGIAPYGAHQHHPAAGRTGLGVWRAADPPGDGPLPPYIPGADPVTMSVPGPHEALYALHQQQQALQQRAAGVLPTAAAVAAAAGQAAGTVRMLAPSFDALASHAAAPASGVSAAAAAAPSGAVPAGGRLRKLAPGTTPHQPPAAARGHTIPITLHSDSSDSEGDGEISPAKPAAGVAAGKLPAGRVQAATAASRFDSAASFRAWAGPAKPAAAVLGSPPASTRPRTVGLPLTAAAVAAAASQPPTGKRAAAAAAPPPAVGPASPVDGSGPSPSRSGASIEAVTAMNVALVNVASQLTEVSRASLELAAEVVAGGGGPGGSPYHPHRGVRDNSSVGSGVSHQSHSYLPHGYAAMDGTYGRVSGVLGHNAINQRQQQQRRSGTTLSSVDSPGGEAAPPARALSPFRVAYGAGREGEREGNAAAAAGAGAAAAGRAGAGAGGLPSWRQVAVNQLYGASGEELYDEDDVMEALEAGGPARGSGLVAAVYAPAAEDAGERRASGVEEDVGEAGSGSDVSVGVRGGTGSGRASGSGSGVSLGDGIGPGAMGAVGTAAAAWSAQVGGGGRGYTTSYKNRVFAAGESADGAQDGASEDAL